MAEKSTGLEVKAVRSDNGGEFTSEKFNDYCSDMGIRRQFSTPHTPQQNGVVERKNRTVIEMARTLLNGAGLTDKFWSFAVYTVVHTINRCLLRPHTDVTPYELWFGRKPTINYFKVFGSKCYIKDKSKNQSKFKSRSREGILLGYYVIGKGYMVYDKTTGKVYPTADVKVNKGHKMQIDFEPEEIQIDNNKDQEYTEEAPTAGEDSETPNTSRKEPQHLKDRPSSQVIGNPSAGIQTRRMVEEDQYALLSLVEPRNVKDALSDPNWIDAMDKEMN